MHPGFLFIIKMVQDPLLFKELGRNIVKCYFLFMPQISQKALHTYDS